MLSRNDLEAVLRDHLGGARIHWLAGGIDGDDTNGHVDDVARFVGPNTIVAAAESDNGDVNYSVLQQNLRCLRRLRNGRRQAFEVITLPMPKPVTFLSLIHI